MEQQTLTLPPGSGTITEMAWSPDGKKLAAVTDRGWLHVWYTCTGMQLVRRHLGRPCLLTVAWSPNGRQLQVGGANGTLYRISRLTAPLLTITLFTAPISRIAWSSSGRCLVVSGSCLTLLGAGNQTHIEYPAPILDAAWGPDGRRLAVVCGNGLVDVRDADQHRSRFSRSDIPNPSCLSFHPDGRLAVGTTNGQMSLYDPHTGHLDNTSAPVAFPLYRLVFGARCLIASDREGHGALMHEQATLPLPDLAPPFVLDPQGTRLATVQPGRIAFLAL